MVSNVSPSQIHPSRFHESSRSLQLVVWFRANSNSVAESHTHGWRCGPYGRKESLQNPCEDLVCSLSRWRIAPSWHFFSLFFFQRGFHFCLSDFSTLITLKWIGGYSLVFQQALNQRYMRRGIFRDSAFKNCSRLCLKCAGLLGFREMFGRVVRFAGPVFGGFQLNAGVLKILLTRVIVGAYHIPYCTTDTGTFVG